MRDKSVSTAERTFVAACVSAGRRLDGRRLTDSRHVKLSLGPIWGFAELSFDKTHVVASTTVEPITPPSDRSNEGSLSIVLDLSPASSESSARDALQRTAVSVSTAETRNCIDKFVRESRAIDTEALCILAGVKVWSVRVEVDVINDDGNCVDACVMAVMASLMHARRPDVTVTGKDVRIHPMDEREPVALPVHHVPLSVTFALFGAGKPYESDYVILDPVKKEEISSGGAISFAFNAQGEVCGVYKAGGLPLELESFVRCSELGEQRALQLTGILKDALANASAQHPLATVRPMLVHPEPSALIKPRDQKDKDDVMEDVVPSSMWNATPVVDAAPPPPLVGDNIPVKMNKVDGAMDAVVESIFEKNDENIGHGTDHDRKMISAEKVEAEKRMVETIVVSDSESSDDNLENALISKPKVGVGRRR